MDHRKATTCDGEALRRGTLRDRRTVLKVLAGLGVGSATFQRALAAQAATAAGVTAEMIRQAEWVAGLELSEQEREATARAVQGLQQQIESLRQIDVDYDVPPALSFSVAPLDRPRDLARKPAKLAEAAAPRRPASDEALAFLPVTELAPLVRTKQVSSVELTRLYLDRLKRYDKALHCVVTFTDELAMEQAERADREIAAGRYRGPLHGIPWGAKDLIACPPYKTTWGAPQFKDQQIDVQATVARRLDEAGAVLVAKLSLGALAWGDKWFGGMTRNPWNPRQGSSGSSAGSASATAAGLVGFALGSETLGSIVSPCRRCGATGLRPTFGRVSRYGCMPLAWSMDKIGPIARSVEDCALIFSVIHGSDGLDPTAQERPFEWPCPRDVRTLTVGYFDDPESNIERRDHKVLRELGVKLVPIELPKTPPADPLTVILSAEAASVFDGLLRAGDTAGLNRWPDAWREAEFIPAVEYLRANRIRTLLMREMEKVFIEVDVYVGGNDLTITNLTGHPTVVLPDGLYKQDGIETPSSITFTGRLFGESELLALARAYQQATGHHLLHPPMERLERDAPQDATEP